MLFNIEIVCLPFSVSDDEQNNEIDRERQKLITIFINNKQPIEMKPYYSKELKQKRIRLTFKPKNTKTLQFNSVQFSCGMNGFYFILDFEWTS